MCASKRRSVLTLSFLVWCVAVLAIGMIVGQVSAVARYAEATGRAISVVELDNAKLAGKELGAFHPYYPERSDFDARGHTFFESSDGNLSIGVWEATPGLLDVPDPYDVDELMYVLEGRIILTDADGNVSTHEPGDGVVLPKGWTGTFGVPDGVRKIYVTYGGK